MIKNQLLVSFVLCLIKQVYSMSMDNSITQNTPQGYATVQDTANLNPVNGRAINSPFASPPFPFADWCGGPVIGEPTSDYPDFLFKGLQKASKKLWTKWNNTGIHIYGWVDASVNGSTSKQTNSPMSYDLVPNRPEFDQVILRFEREPNTVQTTKIDWGFLIDNIYGMDYRYTIAQGFFSNQLLQRNKLYGFDIPELFAMLYIPKVAQGMEIKAGRFISPSDIEAQWAPSNYLYSHSLMFAADPYTFTGVITTIRLHPQWQIEFGIHAGDDMMPWSKSAQANGHLMARWVSKDNQESVYGGINAIGRGDYKYGHDDLQMVVAVWGHKFDERIHTMTEGYYMWEKNAARGGTAIYGAGLYGQGGGEGIIIPGNSGTVGLVNYLEIMCSQKDYVTIRNDALNDITGSRTGYATWFTSHTIGLAHHFSDFITIRPEVRYDHAWNNRQITPYDNGTKKWQFVASMDLFICF